MAPHFFMREPGIFRDSALRSTGQAITMESAFYPQGSWLFYYHLLFFMGLFLQFQDGIVLFCVLPSPLHFSSHVAWVNFLHLILSTGNDETDKPCGSTAKEGTKGAVLSRTHCWVIVPPRACDKTNTWRMQTCQLLSSTRNSLFGIQIAVDIVPVLSAFTPLQPWCGSLAGLKVCSPGRGIPQRPLKLVPGSSMQICPLNVAKYESHALEFQ